MPPSTRGWPVSGAPLATQRTTGLRCSACSQALSVPGNCCHSALKASLAWAGQASKLYGGGTTYEVTVAIDPLLPAQLQRIRLGMSARLAIVTYRAENGLALPAEALHQSGEGSTFVIHRKTMHEASRQVAVTPGRAVPQGIEVFGLESGYVQLLESAP